MGYETPTPKIRKNDWGNQIPFAVEGGCDMSLKYPESRGGFVKFHPPPSTKIIYFFTWLFNCGYYTQLHLPPPNNQYGNRKQRSFIKIQETFRKGRSDPKNLC